jgi:hypothetical protein
LIREFDEGPEVHGNSRSYFVLARCAVEITYRAVRATFALVPYKRFIHKCKVRLAAGRMTEILSRSRSRRKGDSSLVREAPGLRNS